MPPDNPSVPRRTQSRPHPVVARAGTGPTLYCTAGPKAGEQYILSDEVVVVGRSAEATISIPDTSVSRRHFQISKSGDAWKVSDLGSGNGTLLNGERLEGEQELNPGDVLTCGDTQFAFNEDPTHPRSRPPRRSAPVSGAPPPRRFTGSQQRIYPGRPAVGAGGGSGLIRKVVVALSLIAVVFAGLFGMKYVQDQRAAAGRAEQLKLLSQINLLFQQGRKESHDGDWTSAKAKFEQVKKEMPSYEGIDEYLAAATKEAANQQALEAAESALKNNQLAAAATALSKVSSDTVLFERLGTLKSAFDKRKDERLAESQRLLRGADRGTKDTTAEQQAIAIVDDLLKVVPDNRDAIAVKEEATQQIAKKNQPIYVPTAPNRPWVKGVSSFIDGDVTAAIEQLRACARSNRVCQKKLNWLNDFNRLYRRVEELDAAALGQLLDLDLKITDGDHSKLGQRAGKRASNSYYRTAAAAKAAGQWSRALEYAQRCHRADPGQGACEAIISEMRNKAKDLYYRAYTIKDSNSEEAIPLFREVFQLTSPGDEFHDKSKHWLEVLK